MATDKIPAQTSEVQKMRFLYPLAAVCFAAVSLAPTSGKAQADYDKLGPGDIGAFQLAMMNGVRVN
ncbi:MAG: hypothetical protein ABL956_19270 [Hyphomonadaceae bacterium]